MQGTVLALYVAAGIVAEAAGGTKSHADRVWPRAAERSPRTYRVRAMRRSLAFDGFFGAVRCGAALHRIGCLVMDGGATRAVQLAATSRCRHMAREFVPRC